MPRPRSTLDITTQIAPLHDIAWKNKIQMHSYERPALLFWNGVARGLEERGYEEEQIFEVLQSSAARHLLDRMDHEIEALGRRVAKTKLTRGDINDILREDGREG